jgi:hypothetical protein
MPNPCSLDTDFMRRVEAAPSWVFATVLCTMWLFRLGRLVPASVRTRSTSCSGNYRTGPDFVMYDELDTSISLDG